MGESLLGNLFCPFVPSATPFKTTPGTAPSLPHSQLSLLAPFVKSNKPPMSTLRLSAAHAAGNIFRTPSYARSTHSAAVYFPGTRVGISVGCNAISGSQTQEVIGKGLRLIKWEEIGVPEEDDREEDFEEQRIPPAHGLDKIGALVGAVRAILAAVDQGHISASPYDTACVALVEAAGRRPQFPSCLDWISRNQLGDGSWGDRQTFSIYDRILNTLACVIALTTWNLHRSKAERGVRFIGDNIHKLGDEREERMPIGFEVAFPSLLKKAQQLNIAIPHDSQGLRRIYAKRELKLTRIPRDVMHSVPTTLLHSLEGIPGLIWEKLIKLQSADGSFLFSPSSTAFALRQTGNRRCLEYLANVVRKFHGGVPNVYPVDLFERIWAVDRLQRLGISRYFQTEIDAFIDYVHRHWTEKGICWARNSDVQDIDDTSMAFRLLRLHGRPVSAGAFSQFERRGEFLCFAGQSTQAVTGMYNLYRAAQVIFPGEQVLSSAASFSGSFLREKRARNDLVDKWLITKDLPGEVGYALEVPWYASLPRLEARFYLEQYGGDDDVWIGKTLYRMPHVNNEAYLELAKLDYTKCQTLHQHEWTGVLKWYENRSDHGPSERDLLLAYFTAAACIFEPERSVSRIAWAETAILAETLSVNFRLHDQKRAFVDEFERGERYEMKMGLVGKLKTTLNQLALAALLAHGRDIREPLNQAWLKWLKTWAAEGGENARKGDAELLVRTINLTGGGGWPAAEAHPEYLHLLEVITGVCHQLRLFQQTTEEETTAPPQEIELGMQKLVQLVFTRSADDLSQETKQNFLMVAKSFYYTAYFSPAAINLHMARVLFERVL